MKNKLIFCGIALLIFGICFVAQASLNPVSTRYHQHISAGEKAQCTHGDGVFCTHLPIVIVDTRGNAFIDKDRTPCGITVIDNSGQNNHIGDTPAVTSDALINVRGNTSYYFDKKQYRINAIGDDGLGRDIAIMGMPEDSNWVLHGPYMDKSLIRNYLMYNLAGEILEQWTPRVRYCELFVVDGDGLDAQADFQGLYLMIEAVTASPDKVQVKLDLDNTRNTSYVVCREANLVDSTVAETFGSYTNHVDHDLIITYPPALRLTQENIDFIQRDVSAFERTIYSLDYDDERLGYGTQVNVASFVDYFIINEFSVNRDAGFISTYAHKNLRGDLVMGPVWDFNNCFDNYMKASNLHDFHMVISPWYGMLVKDELFIEKVIARYQELRKGVLSEAYLMQYIDDTVAYLGDAVDRNFDLWGYTFEHVMTEAENGNPQNHAQAIEALKGKIIERGNWLDKNIVLLRQFCAESKVKSDN